MIFSFRYCWRLVMVLLFFSTKTWSQQTHTLSGKVIDFQTLFPVPNSTLWSDSTNVVTADHNGNFEIEIADTLINIYVAKQGYDTLFYFIQHENLQNRLIYIYDNGYIPPSVIPLHLHFQILDAKTKQPIPYVSVSDKYYEKIGITDELGWVDIHTTQNVDSIFISTMSYKERFIPVSELDSGGTVTLEEVVDELQTVIKRARRERYSNKNNPAVDLIRKVIDRKEKNYFSDTLTGLSYEQYEKVQMGNYDIPRFITHNFLTRRQSFIFNNVDTEKYKPHGITPIYIQENLSNVYIKENVNNKITELKALKKVQFNENYIAGSSIENYLSHIYINFDLKDENMMVITNQFMSPMAKLSPVFYKFYISDTITTEGKTLIELYFGPRNKNDFLFLGRLYINLENYAVEYAKMSLSKDINLNFVKDIKFDIRYKQLASGKYIMNYHNLFADFNMVNQTNFGVYGEKLLSIDNIKEDMPLPDSLWKNKRKFVDEDSIFAATRNNWDTLRHYPLSTVESIAYRNMDSLYHQKSFNRKLKWMRFILGGYMNIGKYWEIGQTNTFYTYNPVEGFKLRLGGRTVINNTKKFHFQTYVGYGFGDDQWKYFGSASIALYKDKNRILTEYPYNYIKITSQNDGLLPGMQPGFIQEGGIFMSVKRGVNDKYLYNRYYKVEYYKEFANHIRMVPFAQWVEQKPAGSWYYIKGDATYNDTVHATVNSEVGITLRWAPNEKIIQGRTSRTEMNNKYPIFNFTAKYGLKDVLDGAYNYQNYNLDIFKRIYIPQMGFINFRIGGNYIVGENLPFTLLHMPSGNQTYWLNTNDYMLMNSLEFISDRNVYLNAEYHLYGFIFNKIPLFKKLKFREVVGVKMLYGDISSKNMPIVNPNVFKFPLNAEGKYTTSALGKDPYIEAYAGVTNILGFFRVDAIWRLTYLEKPNVSPFAVRVGAQFDF